MTIDDSSVKKIPKEGKSLKERFMAKVSPEPNTGCWLWMGALTADDAHGYGQIGRNQKVVLAHRVAYELYRGPIPDGLQLDHLCRVRCCVNPQHLEPVTQSINLLRNPLMARADKINKTHCPAGHPYNEWNTYRRKNRPCRQCRICHAMHCAKWRKKFAGRM